MQVAVVNARTVLIAKLPNNFFNVCNFFLSLSQYKGIGTFAEKQCENCRTNKTSLEIYVPKCCLDVPL